MKKVDEEIMKLLGVVLDRIEGIEVKMDRMLDKSIILYYRTKKKEGQ